MVGNEYKIPEWMDDHILECLGGRKNVVELMSGRRLNSFENPALHHAQVAMEAEIALLGRLHVEHVLVAAPKQTFVVEEVTRYVIRDTRDGKLLADMLGTTYHCETHAQARGRAANRQEFVDRWAAR